MTRQGAGLVAAGHDGVEEAEQELLEHDRTRCTVLDRRERREVADAIWRLIERNLALEELCMTA